MFKKPTEGQVRAIKKVIQLAEAMRDAERASAPELVSICSQPVSLPVPPMPSTEGIRLREFLQSLNRDERAAVQAVFWLGRGYPRVTAYPALLERSYGDLERFEGYMMDKVPFVRQLKKGLNVLGV